MNGKKSVIFRTTVLFFIIFLFPASQGRCEDTAFEQLLSIFKQKGVLTVEEAGALQAAYLSEQSALKEKEAMLEEKEKRLEKWEESLSEKSAQAVPAPLAVAPADGAVPAPDAEKEKREVLALETAYDDGFGLYTKNKPDMSLFIKGLLQTDYRAYDYPGEDPAEDKFDVRRARLILRGDLTDLARYYFQYEFEGAGSRRLLDAYADIDLAEYTTLRLGQYKEPFGLEQTSSDQDLFFAERAMGYYLTPGRDVGLSAFGNFWNDRFYYSLGVFNGDGKDDASGGDEDALETTGRLAFRPLKDTGIALPADLQLGLSGSYAKIDRNNVRLDVKTTGLTSFLEVTSSAKFHVIQDADSRYRLGADLGVSFGPWAVWGEYSKIEFEDVEAGTDVFSFDAQDAYGSVLFMLTGEHIGFKNGRILPVEPDRPVTEGGLGAFGIAFRYDDFEADQAVYDYLVQSGTSVREATAYSIALNWYLNRFARLTLDATRTEFDEPLLIFRDSRTGQAIYSDREDVVTGRFQIGF